MVGKLAVSLAGHDKGSIFLVIREDGDVIWLADGISRLYQSPKRKKKKPRSAGFKRRDGQQRAGGSFPKPGGRGYENQTLHKTL